MFFGGVDVKENEKTLKEDCPHIVVGTPGRINGLVRDKILDLRSVKFVILDGCDTMFATGGEIYRLEN